MKRIGSSNPPDLPGGDDPVGVLVMSFLMWESTTEMAVAGYRRILDDVVDFNDLRVTMPHEIVECIGDRYPLALDRTQRLRAALRDIYLREHQVSLSRLITLGKREVKKYIETLDGVVAYVASRVMLLCFETHAVPVDEQLRRCLIDANVADEDTEIHELASWLGRHIKAGDGVQAHYDLQAWVDRSATTAPSRKKQASKTEARKSGQTVAKGSITKSRRSSKKTQRR